jgi:class 3 adenylate cyclase
VPFVAFAAGLAMPGMLAYQLLQYGAERETHEKSVTALSLVSAARKATDEDGTVPANGKSGVYHQGTTVASQLMKTYDAGRHEDSFQYKRVTVNPTDPRNASNELETRLLRRLANNPQLAQAEEEIQQNGRGYHVLATPVKATQDKCLQCHGYVRSAPAWRLKRYGRTAGFGWQKGQVVALDVVYIPSDFPRTQAKAIFWSVAKSIGLLSLICVAMLYIRAYFMITRPIKRLVATSESIQRGEWNHDTGSHFPDEIADLAVSFESTSCLLRSKIVREEKLRSLFQQFIPASIAATALGKNADDVLAGTRHGVTVMIINIRNFKLLMDHLPPDQTVATLNEYFAAVNKIIVSNKGLVSKYMGDSVMALFGMPLGKDNHALGAVRAALAIPAALQDLYVRLDEKFGWELGVGIGISTGEPIIGSFGSSEHFEYSILGDVVAEAQCLEASTKSVPEEDSILISEATYRGVMSDVHVLDLGTKPGPKGESLHAYVVQGLRAEVRSTMAE